MLQSSSLAFARAHSALRLLICLCQWFIGFRGFDLQQSVLQPFPQYQFVHKHHIQPESPASPGEVSRRSPSPSSSCTPKFHFSHSWLYTSTMLIGTTFYLLFTHANLSFCNTLQHDPTNNLSLPPSLFLFPSVLPPFLTLLSTIHSFLSFPAPLSPLNIVLLLFFLHARGKRLPGTTTYL